MTESKTLWLHRKLLNTREVYEWAETVGIKKMMPANELHLTLATIREPVSWSGLTLQTNQLSIPAGHKTVQIFGYMAKAIAFGSQDVKERHTELAALFPTMDHSSMLRPHVTLMRGGKMPRGVYEGPLEFGPEIAEEFNETAVRDIKHWLVKDVLAQMRAADETG